jgi:hypothetical protein
MTQTGWMLFKKGKPMFVVNGHRLYLRKIDAENYFPEKDRKKIGITLEKVSVEITVIPTRRKK